MARDSIPPVFDMAYRPVNRQVFGPPKWSWTLPVVYLLVAVGFAAAAEISHFAPQSSWLWRFFVEQDVHRLISARTFALLLGISAAAAILRTSMRGVLIHPDGIEARGAMVLGWPRIKTCEWVEIDRVMLDEQAVGLRLWDGSTLWLPAVADRDGLAREVERIAQLRAIPMRRNGGVLTVRHAEA